MKKVRIKALVLCAVMVAAVLSSFGVFSASATTTVVYKYYVKAAAVAGFSGSVSFPANKLSVSSAQVYDGNFGDAYYNVKNGKLYFNASGSHNDLNFSSESAMVTVTFNVNDSSYNESSITTEVEEFYTQAQAKIKNVNTPFTYRSVLGAKKTGSGYVDITNPSNSYVDPTDLKFKSKFLNLNTNIGYKFKVDKSFFDTIGYTDPYVVFHYTTPDGVSGTRTVRSYYNDDNGDYIFNYTGITPYEMKTKIYAVLHAKYDGRNYQSNPTSENSPVDYCMTTLNRETSQTKLSRLIVDLLNYASETQKYVPYHTDDLANSALTSAQQAFGTQTISQPTLDRDVNHVVLSGATATWTGFTINLNDAVYMRLHFTAPESSNLKIDVTSDDANDHWVIDKSSFKKQSDGSYWYYFKAVTPDQMEKNFYFKIMNGSTVISNTYRTNIASYIKRGWNNSSTGDLLKAMYKYGCSVKNY